MTYIGKTDCTALVCDSIVQNQVISAHLDENAIAIQDEDTRFADGVRVRQGSWLVCDMLWRGSLASPCRPAPLQQCSEAHPRPQHENRIDRRDPIPYGR